MTTTSEELTNIDNLKQIIIDKTILHIFKVEDEDLLILKGHLLIDSVLRDYCKSKTIKPDAFDSAKLSFRQLLNLTQSFKGDLENEKFLWDVVKNINTFRNQIAHQLDNQETLKSNRQKIFNSFNPEENLKIDKKSVSKFYLLKHIIVLTYVTLLIELHLTKHIIHNIIIDKLN